MRFLLYFSVNQRFIFRLWRVIGSSLSWTFLEGFHFAFRAWKYIHFEPDYFIDTQLGFLQFMLCFIRSS
jgi:hypothetical protein